MPEEQTPNPTLDEGTGEAPGPQTNENHNSLAEIQQLLESAGID